MAGLGRRTHYRKHLTDHVLFDLPEPDKSERIAKVVGTRGSNQFDVQIANQHSIGEQLAILPTKFRKLVWVKRNDFVIVQTVEEGEAEEPADASGGIRYMITHILYKDQIRHLQSKGIWPTDDPDFAILSDTAGVTRDGDDKDPQKESDHEFDDEGEEHGGYADDDDPLLFVNTNRVAKLVLEDSSSSEEED